MRKFFKRLNMTNTPSIRSIPREEFPWPSGGTSNGIVFSDGYYGAIVYACWPNGNHEEPLGYAVLRIDGGTAVTTGSPNDEAQGNHPVSEIMNDDDGFFVELVNSPWIPIILRQAHKDRVYPSFLSCKHFVFFFKENTVEFFADGFTHIGTYAEASDAYKAAISCLD